jgi:hypothetical protein
MATPKKQPQFGVEHFFPGLRSLVTNLPTREQKNEIDLALTQLIDFLKDLQSRFQTIPSLEDSEQARQTVSAMQEFLQSAVNQPMIAAALGGAAARAKNKKTPSTPSSRVDVAVALAELEKLPSNEIRVRLDKYTLSDLRVIAIALNLEPPSKITKPDIVIQIVGYFLNRRSVRNEDTPMFDASMKIPGGWPSS